MVKLLKQVVLIETKHEECISYYFIQIEFFLNEKSSAFLFYILILYSYFIFLFYILIFQKGCHHFHQMKVFFSFSNFSSI